MLKLCAWVYRQHATTNEGRQDSEHFPVLGVKEAMNKQKLAESGKEDKAAGKPAGLTEEVCSSTTVMQDSHDLLGCPAMIYHHV